MVEQAKSMLGTSVTSVFSNNDPDEFILGQLVEWLQQISELSLVISNFGSFPTQMDVTEELSALSVGTVGVTCAHPLSQKGKFVDSVKCLGSLTYLPCGSIIHNFFICPPCYGQQFLSFYSTTSIYKHETQCIYLFYPFICVKTYPLSCLVSNYKNPVLPNFLHHVFLTLNHSLIPLFFPDLLHEHRLAY